MRRFPYSILFLKRISDYLLSQLSAENLRNLVKKSRLKNDFPRINNPRFGSARFDDASMKSNIFFLCAYRTLSVIVYMRGIKVLKAGRKEIYSGVEHIISQQRTNEAGSLMPISVPYHSLGSSVIRPTWECIW